MGYNHKAALSAAKKRKLRSTSWKPSTEDQSISLVWGNCKERLKELEDCSIDSIVTDPPYEIGICGANWDKSGIAYDIEVWKECLRVLKPGGYLLAFAATRTYHRMVCAIEDAGFEVRECLVWHHGMGFPKSTNVSIGVDKYFGESRKVVGKGASWNRPDGKPSGNETLRMLASPGEYDITEPTTEQALNWDGFGSALKPSFEPIVMARKPMESTLIENVLVYGTGSLNIDGCRVATDWNEPDRSDSCKRSGHTSKPGSEKIIAPDGNGIICNPKGRWPANAIFTHAEKCVYTGTKVVKSSQFNGCKTPRKNVVYGKDDRPRNGGFHAPNNEETVLNYRCVQGCPVLALDRQSGIRPGMAGGGKHSSNYKGGMFGSIDCEHTARSDTGTASRFFTVTRPDPPFLYTAKACASEREAGCEMLGNWWKKERKNIHTTVKPLEVMRWLVRLVTPPTGKVLDPFMGSGTTGIAALLEGMSFIGIELGKEHLEIAKARIEYHARQVSAATRVAVE